MSALIFESSEMLRYYYWQLPRFQESVVSSSSRPRSTRAI